MTPGGLARSREELAAARLLAGEGFRAQAISRAYFAAFFAAEAALVALGETRSKHSGVISAFGRLVVRERGFDEAIGRLLPSPFERRNEADYALVEVPEEEAEGAPRRRALRLRGGVVARGPGDVFAIAS